MPGPRIERRKSSCRTRDHLTEDANQYATQRDFYWDGLGVNQTVMRGPIAHELLRSSERGLLFSLLPYKANSFSQFGLAPKACS